MVWQWLAWRWPRRPRARPPQPFPGAPTGASAIPGVRSAKVSFTKPADTGGSKITGYRVKCASTDGGKTQSLVGPKSPIFVAGMTAGKTYSCTVKARNKVGFGPASLPSNNFQPRVVVPGAPTNATATAGVRSVKLTFTPPGDNGGSKILNYRAKCKSSDGGNPASHVGPKSPIQVSGLAGGKTYTCTVRARNRIGYGPESTPSSAVVTKGH